jgi:hypothetical protein
MGREKTMIMNSKISRQGQLNINRAWTTRIIATLAIVTVLAGCGGGDDPDPVPTGVVASFSGSGTAAQDNQVRLVGGATSGDTVTVEVACGETDSLDVYGFAFDLVLSDPSVAEYVSGSVEAGGAFSGNVIAVAEQNNDRIVIGVSQTDQTGDAIAGPESIVVRLSLKVLKTGTTEISFEGSTGSNPTSDPSAVDSGGTPIGTIVFDAVPATVIGR